MYRGIAARSLVIALAVSVSAALAVPAHAQYLAPATDRPGSDQRPTQPSLRLASLGGLSLAIADENNEINLWDFAHSSLGLLGDRDSTSMDVYLDRGGLTDQHTVGTLDRELARNRRGLLGFQAVGRTPGRFAVGVDVGYLTTNLRVPAQDGLYLERNITTPVAIPTLNGRFGGGAWGWGAHLTLGARASTDDLRFESLKNGRVELARGDLVATPNPFVVDHGKTRVGGFGIGLGWSGIKGLETAINWDRISDRVRTSNTNAHRVFETEEPQASNEISFAAIAHPGWATVGAQVGSSRFDSKEEYRFSLSGGLNGPPTVARGDVLYRAFRQKWMRTRVALEPPGFRALTLAGDFAVRYDKDLADPSTAPGNYNDFQQSIAGDTLGIAQPVLASKAELRHWSGGVGVGYRLSARTRVGIEGHVYQNTRDGAALHVRQRIKDLRGGLEFAVTPA
ncbi:MAG: hypothetical protein ABI960_07125, partial [Candidatus Eisenbacteria bacterium]